MELVGHGRPTDDDETARLKRHRAAVVASVEALAGRLMPDE
ncbi:hypothetical protein AB0L10_30610 [Streptomyces flaveolus]